MKRIISYLAISFIISSYTFAATLKITTSKCPNTAFRLALSNSDMCLHINDDNCTMTKLGCDTDKQSK